MSFLLDRSYPSSFLGVRFLYISSDMNAGRKSVIHEYPNQNFRFVEDLGENLRTFSIQAVVTGFFYEDNKIALNNVLNSGKTGVFIHPHDGSINCYCSGFSVSESNSTTNIATYNINFIETNESTFPSATRNNRTNIADLYRKMYVFIKDDLNGQYIADFSNNILSAAQQLRSLIDVMNLISASLNSLNDNKKEFNKQSKHVISKSIQISSPEGDIGGEISDSILSFDSLTDGGQTRFDASNKLFGFGDDDTFFNDNTLEIKQKNKNQKLINGTINALSFINLIDSAKEIDYRDEDQLNNTINIIDNNYNKMIDTAANNFSNSLIDLIDEVRSEIRIFFQQKRQTINKIIKITTNTIPMTVLAYKYYENLDDYDELLSLNEKFNPSVISGELRILEA